MSALYITLTNHTGSRTLGPFADGHFALGTLHLKTAEANPGGGASEVLGQFSGMWSYGREKYPRLAIEAGGSAGAAPEGSTAIDLEIRGYGESNYSRHRVSRFAVEPDGSVSLTGGLEGAGEGTPCAGRRLLDDIVEMIIRPGDVGVEATVDSESRETACGALGDLEPDGAKADPAASASTHLWGRVSLEELAARHRYELAGYRTIKGLWKNSNSPEALALALAATGAGSPSGLRQYAVWVARQVRHIAIADQSGLGAIADRLLETAEAFAEGAATRAELDLAFLEWESSTISSHAAYFATTDTTLARAAAVRAIAAVALDDPRRAVYVGLDEANLALCYAVKFCFGGDAAVDTGFQRRALERLRAAAGDPFSGVSPTELAHAGERLGLGRTVEGVRGELRWPGEARKRRWRGAAVAAGLVGLFAVSAWRSAGAPAPLGPPAPEERPPASTETRPAAEEPEFVELVLPGATAPVALSAGRAALVRADSRIESVSVAGCEGVELNVSGTDLRVWAPEGAPTGSTWVVRIITADGRARRVRFETAESL